MHIVLGLLGSIISILYVLDRLGVDIGWLNPRYWRHRRDWAKKYHGDPIYSIEDPVQVAAVLIVGVAKLEGDLSAEQKQAILGQFENKFSLDSRAASELFGSVAHLLGAPQVIGSQLDGLATKYSDSFKSDQAESVIEMIEQTAAVGGTLSITQREYVDGLRSKICSPEQSGTWT